MLIVKRAHAFALLVAVLLALPAMAQAKKPAPESARVEHLGTLPAPAGIGANFKRYDDGKTYMFVTTTGGVYVYDVTQGDDPQPVSALPLPHYENEDVSIGGNRLLLSGDGTLGGSLLTVVDISDPHLLKVERTINMQLIGEGHTSTCIHDCHYVWVAGDRNIAVLNLDEADQLPSGTIPGLPGVQVQAASSKVEVGDITGVKEFGWSTHDVQVDGAGYAWVVGGDGTAGFDTRPGQYPRPDLPYPQNLLQPKLVARTGPAALNDGDFFGGEDNGDTVNDFIHHNSWRPDASRFSSRRTRDLSNPDVRPGELVLITEEDIWDRTTGSAPNGCETEGSFQTWQVKQFGSPDENTSTVQHLDSWTTEANKSPDALEAARASEGFCSSHYFSERDDIVATAWYDQGTRFLDVSDPGDIKQVAYFMAPGSTTWATYWSPTDRNVVYVVDNNRGVDVLRFERGSVKRAAARGREEVSAPIASWWKRQNLRFSAAADPKFGWACRLAL